MARHAFSPDAACSSALVTQLRTGSTLCRLRTQTQPRAVEMSHLTNMIERHHGKTLLSTSLMGWCMASPRSRPKTDLLWRWWRAQAGRLADRVAAACHLAQWLLGPAHPAVWWGAVPDSGPALWG